MCYSPGIEGGPDMAAAPASYFELEAAPVSFELEQPILPVCRAVAGEGGKGAVWI